jgi:hypothetical protein
MLNVNLLLYLPYTGRVSPQQQTTTQSTRGLMLLSSRGPRVGVMLL